MCGVGRCGVDNVVIDPSLLVGNIGLEIGLLYQGNSCINTSIYFLVKIVKIISLNQNQTPALSSSSSSRLVSIVVVRMIPLGISSNTKTRGDSKKT